MVCQKKGTRTGKEEAKKKELAKLKQITEEPPFPVIDDQQYNKQRAEMADSVYDAVDKVLLMLRLLIIPLLMYSQYSYANN